MPEANFDWKLLAPEYILVAWAGMLIMLDLFWPAGGIGRWKRLDKESLGYIAAAGALIAVLVSLIWVDHVVSGVLRTDRCFRVRGLRAVR
ncbi:MAG: hypothetical protein E6J43_13145 [Chloroflexi bacterium]|nr:MAG: hypothetical protein E6J43_13145 [Chloroflexota bacterium]